MDAIRIDLFLKYVCLFKHRSGATDACKGGRVKLNGQRVKPSSGVKPDDVVEITEPHYRKIVVLEVPVRQASKESAHSMYRDETPEVPLEEKRPVVERERGAGRPSRKDRRDIERWKKTW